MCKCFWFRNNSHERYILKSKKWRKNGIYKKYFSAYIMKSQISSLQVWTLISVKYEDPRWSKSEVQCRRCVKLLDCEFWMVIKSSGSLFHEASKCCVRSNARSPRESRPQFIKPIENIAKLPTAKTTFK